MEESANTEETPLGGASRKPLSPGNLRKPGLREAAVRAALDAVYRSGERELHCVFSSDLKPISIEKRDVRQMIAEVEATS